MKTYIEVEKDRIDSHKYLNKNTVHRSSLIVPRFDRIKLLYNVSKSLFN